MRRDKTDVKDIATIAGAFVAFSIGSGFATGQEIMQFFSSYGILQSLGACAIATVLFMWAGGTILRDSKALRLKAPNAIFVYYCGNIIGTVFECAIPVYLFMEFVMMTSGAGATISEYYGLNHYLGSAAMAAAAFATVMLGLENLVRIIGKIGPLIILFSIGTGIAGILSSPGGLAAAPDILSTIYIPKPSPSWVMAGILYAAYNIFGMAAFLAGMGKTARSGRSAGLGGMSAGFVLGITILVMNYGMLANIGEVYNKDVPSLVLAHNVFPAVGVLFSIIITAGIYTTAVPLLWSVCNVFSHDESSLKFRAVAGAMSAVGLLLGNIPFNKLVNTIYPYTGYLGMLFLACVAIKKIRQHKCL